MCIRDSSLSSSNRFSALLVDFPVIFKSIFDVFILLFFFNLGLNQIKATHQGPYRLANVGILGKEREPGVGKLGWHGNFDTGFEKNNFV